MEQYAAGPATTVTEAHLGAARWRKSGRSMGQGECVEAALLHTAPAWRKSGRSAGQGECVEATTDGAVVALQNSKLRHPDGAVLTVTATDWLAFLDAVAAGHTDRNRLGSPAAFGPFALALATDGSIEVRFATEPSSPVVRYTPAEWDTFSAGVQTDGEFTLPWLMAASLPVS